LTPWRPTVARPRPSCSRDPTDAANASGSAIGSLDIAGEGKKTLSYGWSLGVGTTIAAAGLKDYIDQTGAANDGASYVGFMAMRPIICSR
jgi:hypothetical protein